MRRGRLLWKQKLSKLIYQHYRSILDPAAASQRLGPLTMTARVLLKRVIDYCVSWTVYGKRISKGQGLSEKPPRSLPHSPSNTAA